MTLNDIPPDVTLVLTDEMNRLFRIAKCDPTCHCCRDAIAVGDYFKLQTHAVQKFGTRMNVNRIERDIMLCSDCDTTKLAAKEKKDHRERKKWMRAHPRAGYSRPHRSSK